MRVVRLGRIAACLAVAVLAASLLPTQSEEKKAAPAPQPGPRLNAYFAKGFEDAAWQRAAFDKVARSWKAASPPEVGKKAVVISTITRDGKVMEAKIGTPSGSEGWDQAAVEAVKSAAPFPPLPRSWAGTSLEVHWHFALEK